MDVTLHISEDIGRRLFTEGSDAARIALEALALEGYRSRILFESDLCRILGFESRLDVHAFLKQHGIYLQYGPAELEADEATFRSLQQEFPHDAVSHRPR